MFSIICFYCTDEIKSTAKIHLDIATQDIRNKHCNKKNKPNNVFVQRYIEIVNINLLMKEDSGY